MRVRGGGHLTLKPHVRRTSDPRASTPGDISPLGTAGTPTPRIKKYSQLLQGEQKYGLLMTSDEKNFYSKRPK